MISHDKETHSCRKKRGFPTINFPARFYPSDSFSIRSRTCSASLSGPNKIGSHAKSIPNSLGTIRVTLATEIPGLDIYYSFDNTTPDPHGTKYTEPVIVPLNASRITVMTYRGKEPVGTLIRLDTKELQARAVKTKRVIGNL